MTYSERIIQKYIEKACTALFFQIFGIVLKLVYDKKIRTVVLDYNFPCKFREKKLTSHPARKKSPILLIGTK